MSWYWFIAKAFECLCIRSIFCLQMILYLLKKGNFIWITFFNRFVQANEIRKVFAKFTFGAINSLILLDKLLNLNLAIEKIVLVFTYRLHTIFLINVPFVNIFELDIIEGQWGSVSTILNLKFLFNLLMIFIFNNWCLYFVPWLQKVSGSE